VTKRLTNQIKDTLRLIARSKSNPDGWVLCSDQCWPIVELLPKELYDFRSWDGSWHVRLTDEARIILKWM
jgi:hypothetical protein